VAVLELKRGHEAGSIPAARQARLVRRHDLQNAEQRLLKKNGYVLKQLYSPLIVHTTPEHAESRAPPQPQHPRHLIAPNLTGGTRNPGGLQPT